MLSRALRVEKLLRQPQVNIVQKRWSGHNNMDIVQTHYLVNKGKDMLHFYTLLALIPTAIITCICNIRANPELAEIPEGYEPRHWEYFKNPIARWICRYFHNSQELENELFIARSERHGEELMLRKIADQVESVMMHYGDHRSRNFRPFFAEYFRKGRDEAMYGQGFITTMDSSPLDRSYDPTKVAVVPTEGYKPTDLVD